MTIGLLNFIAISNHSDCPHKETSYGHQRVSICHHTALTEGTPAHLGWGRGEGLPTKGGLGGQELSSPSSFQTFCPSSYQGGST